MITEERIQKEAHAFAFPDNTATTGYGFREYKGYIAGATFEAARNKENAVAFAEWLPFNGWIKSNQDNNYWLKDMGRETATTEQLYDLFIEQNKKV